MGRYGDNVRVLIGECGAIVDLVVDDQVEILLVVVLGDLLQGEFLDFRHGELRYLNQIGRQWTGFCKDCSEGGNVLSGVGENSSEKCWEIGRTTYGVFRGEIMGPKSSSNIGKEGKEKQREEEREEREEERKRNRRLCQKRTKRNPPNVSGTCGWAVSSCGAQVPGTFDAANYTRLIREGELGKGEFLIGWYIF